MGNKNQTKETTADEKSCRKVQVPSENEVVALNAMRKIKERVRDLKKRMSKIPPTKDPGNGALSSEVEKEMAQLRVAWDEWDKKRKKAARERMVLLGHEEEE